MQPRITIKHNGPRGWARIVPSAFDPNIHEEYKGKVPEAKAPEPKEPKPSTAAPTPDLDPETMTKKELIEALEDLDAEVNKKDSVAELREQLEALLSDEEDE